MSGCMPSIYPVTCHTDHVGPGSTFVVIKGFAHDGTRFIPLAVERGATRIVLSKEAELTQELHALLAQRNITIERVENTRKALAERSAEAAGYPAHQLKIIGITGTKGKTTSAYLLAHLLRHAGRHVGLISSVVNMIGKQTIKAPLTTPQPDYLQQFLRVCVDQQIEWVVMEVAAQALTLHRVDGIQFDAIALTNIAREHLEFYEDMDAYVTAKMAIRSYAKDRAPLWVNGDDPSFEMLRDVHRFGMTDRCELRGMLEMRETFGIQASIEYQEQRYTITSSSLCGLYNLYNILTACALALYAGLSWQQMQEGIAHFHGVPGRLERYELPNGATAIIDYAHNPSSYEALLATLRTQTNELIVLFGAGGERDQGRRPEMGQIAARYADRIILTSDNPRSEDPHDIVAQIAAGIKEGDRGKVLVELDREEAICAAYAQADDHSIIALLGKGGEDYQLVGMQKFVCSERDIINSFYRSRGLKAVS